MAVTDGAPDSICVMTRLRLRSPWELVRFVRSYRRVSKTLTGVPGLLHVSLLAEGPLTWCMFSVWQDENRMGQWIGNPEHVRAVRQTYADLTTETWSTRWRLEAVSPTARSWAKGRVMEHLGGR